MGWSWNPHESPKNIHAFLDHNINPLPVLLKTALLQLLEIYTESSVSTDIGGKKLGYL